MIFTYLDYSEFAIDTDGKRNVTTAIVIAIVIVATIIVVSCAYFFWSKRSELTKHICIQISITQVVIDCISVNRTSKKYDKAWKLWNEEEIISLIDPEICNPDYVDDILRCIHIGLLCVQEIANERPTMATVVSMLNNAFIQRQTEHKGESSQSQLST
ncbi:G-type lectin S-receptor-like serine/threonine-protein kinase At1g11300 [Trifolium pratense]|uniref:G-type lectin S-receptor-like serine/threonine-protein kinase At1g11300 n=1 Tax=Trifolium pratense TaxID=57577 RepID=UPI001E6930DE|nr:G-type lectin S-receptor-like serine/threonine-protein kinase At1g11300 [Trifolium pratense]